MSVRHQEVRRSGAPGGRGVVAGSDSTLSGANGIPPSGLARSGVTVDMADVVSLGIAIAIVRVIPSHPGPTVPDGGDAPCTMAESGFSSARHHRRVVYYLEKLHRCCRRHSIGE